MLLRPADITDADIPVPIRPLASDYSEIEQLVALCGAGRLYEVEAWIDEGGPLDCVPPERRDYRRRLKYPLSVAAERGFTSLVELLLANGYDPNGDGYVPLLAAVRNRDVGVVRVLLRYGTNPTSLRFWEVLDTTNRAIIDAFIEAGVDPCAENAVADALASMRRPILGFVRSYWDRFPGLQDQVNRALYHFADVSNERGVALMLWLGADPHAVVRSDPPPSDPESDSSMSSFEQAILAEHEGIIKTFLKRPIPKEHVPALFIRAAYSSSAAKPALVQRLLREGADPNLHSDGRHTLHAFLNPFDWPPTWNDQKAVDACLVALDLILAAGARFDALDDRALADMRRNLVQIPGKIVVRILEVLKKHQALTPVQLHELIRTPAMQRTLQGYTPSPRGRPRNDYVIPVARPRSEPRGYWKRHWSQR